MEEIIAILMNRDGDSRAEAKRRIRETRSLIYEALGEGREYEIEDILLEELGLELDYIYCFI